MCLEQNLHWPSAFQRRSSSSERGSKNEIAQDEPGRQKRAEPLLANRVNGLDLRDWDFVTA